MMSFLARESWAADEWGNGCMSWEDLLCLIDFVRCLIDIPLEPPSESLQHAIGAINSHSDINT